MDSIPADGNNAWQILAQQYVSNASTSKTVRDGNVRIQKNIIPTENENEFKVYISADAHTVERTTSEQLTQFLEDAIDDNLYVGGSSPNTSTTYLPGEDHNAREGYCISGINPGTEKALGSGGTQAIQLHIRYNNVLIAEPLLHLAVPNSILLYKLPTSDPSRECDYIVLQPFRTHGGNVYTTATGHEDQIQPRTVNGVNIYDVDVDLTDMAYSRLLTTVPGETYSETASIVIGGEGTASNATVTDPMGSYMDKSSVTINNVDGTATVNDGTITWNLSAKAKGTYGIETGTTQSYVIEPYTDSEGVEHSGSVTEKDYWELNVAELVYTVKLDVLKDGFESFKSYDANGEAKLNYRLVTFDGTPTEKELELPKPSVQGRVFYVYHSSDCDVDKYPYTNPAVSIQAGDYMNGGTTTKAQLNLVNLVKTGYLYGGYYNTYAKAAVQSVTDARALSYAVADQKGSTTDTAGTAYDASTANVWKAANAYKDVRGDMMQPVPDTVYYLKEVPDCYIRPYIHFTYDDYDPQKPLKSLYIITATDDTNYKGAGYIVLPADPEVQTDGTKSLLFTVKKVDGTIDATLTAKSVFSSKYSGVMRGYLYWAEASNLIGQASYKYQPCWTTLDGVLVKGVTTRTIRNITTKNDINVSDE